MVNMGKGKTNVQITCGCQLQALLGTSQASAQPFTFHRSSADFCWSRTAQSPKHGSLDPAVIADRPRVMSTSALSRCWHAYERSLQARPVRTQAIMAGTLWAAGDWLAQRAECIGRKRKLRYNYRRTAFTAAYGTFLIGPLGHVWYQNLDKVVSKFLAPSTTSFVAAKVAADTFLYTPLNVGLFFALMTVVEGGHWKEVKQKLQQDFLPTMGAEIAIWPAYQAVNFARVPVQHQLLMCSIGTLFDSSFLCWVHDHNDWLKMVMPGLRSSTALTPVSDTAESIGSLLGSS